MLTLEMLKDMPPDTIFARGEIENSPDGCFMTNASGGMLKWVAVRGKGLPDWTIYCHWSDNPWYFIKSCGDKVCGEVHIKRLVKCDDEAFAMYRL